jgi:hypothetical protein
MPERPREQAVQGTTKRFHAFLDCLASLLAKRWLRDQRQHEQETPQDERDSASERSESL